MNNKIPDIETVGVEINAADLIKLLSPSNKSGIMFFTRDKKMVFVKSSGTRPVIVK